MNNIKIYYLILKRNKVEILNLIKNMLVKRYQRNNCKMNKVQMKSFNRNKILMKKILRGKKVLMMNRNI